VAVAWIDPVNCVAAPVRVFDIESCPSAELLKAVEAGKSALLVFTAMYALAVAYSTASSPSNARSVMEQHVVFTVP
jgi:hypothetical protein